MQEAMQEAMQKAMQEARFAKIFTYVKILARKYLEQQDCFT